MTNELKENELKVFQCNDSDGGNRTFIVCENVKAAIDGFFEQYNYYPGCIYNLSEDQLVIIMV